MLVNIHGRETTKMGRLHFRLFKSLNSHHHHTPPISLHKVLTKGVGGVQSSGW